MDIKIFWPIQPTVSLYYLQYKLSADSTWSETSVSSDNFAVLASLTPCQYYDFRVMAVCGNGLPDQPGPVRTTMINDGTCCGQLISGQLPITTANYYQDTNYQFKPTILSDGQTTTQGEWSPGWNVSNFFYHPYELNLDVSDFQPNVQKVRIFDTNGSGFDMEIILVQADGTETIIGHYDGSGYMQWQEFYFDSTGHTSSPFKVQKIVFRQNNENVSLGSEVEVYGDYVTYNGPIYNKPLKPLKNMLGINAHNYNIVDNVNRTLFEYRYQGLLTLNPTSIRYFCAAWQFLQPSQWVWKFNGWLDEMLNKRLRQDRPSIFTWDSVLGQYNWVTDLWHVPDTNNYVIATVTDVVHYSGWDQIKFTTNSHVGSGEYKQWFVTLNDTPAAGHTLADYNTESQNFFTIPADGTNGYLDCGPNLIYQVGQSIKLTAGHRSQFNIYPQNNNDAGRADPQTWADILGKTAYVYAERKGTNSSNTDPYMVYVDSENQFEVANNSASMFEGMNEPNATWAGYDDFLRGRDLAVAWSVMYDGNKGQFPKCGVKNADPNFKMSLSGLATVDVDLLRGCADWCKQHRGLNVDGSINLPFDYIQFHAYSYTGGMSQFAGGTHGGLPVELSNVLTAIDDFNKFSNKYAKNRPVIIGEWGWDVNQYSPMNAPPIGPYTAEQTRGNWIARALIEYSAHGLDMANWYRLAMDYEVSDYLSNDGWAIQFSTMFLVHYDSTNQVVIPSVAGAYFQQISEFGDFTFAERVNAENPRVLRFTYNGKDIYFIWAVETPTNEANWGNEKPVFTENTGIYGLALPNGIQARTRQFVDNGFGTMTATPYTTISNGLYNVNYSAKPIVVETNWG